MTQPNRIAGCLLGIMILASACSAEGPLAVPDSATSNEPQIVASDCEADALVCGDAIPSDSDSIGMPANGGITVSEALQRSAVGVITVQGFLFEDGSGPLLCEVLAESFPPQCGGASMPISGYESALTVPLVSEQNVTWTDQIVSLTGDFVDGVFVVDAGVSG